ncbi:MAG: hypothetical protein HC882_00595 [Acidobacteria bacterium]|nr:hypothetical protein [Acidobacteriota bacterium]
MTKWCRWVSIRSIPDWACRSFNRLLRNARQPLKTWLLRQDRLVGIGNIYASEILHEAGLDPFRAGGELEPVETRRLHRALKAVLRRAIRYCGTTFSDFQDAHGVTGSYQTRLRVYGREGEPCKRCGAPIVRVSQAQRSTYYCSARCSPDAPPQARKRRPEKRKAEGRPRPENHEGLLRREGMQAACQSLSWEMVFVLDRNSPKPGPER